MANGTISMPVSWLKRAIMPTRRDILIWRAVWIPQIWNIKMQETPFVQEVKTIPHTEHISQAAVVTLIAVLHLFVRIVVVNVWVEIS